MVVQQRQDLHTAPASAADNPTAPCWVSVLPAEQFPNLRLRLGAMRETPPIRRLRPPVSHRPEMAAGNRHQTRLLLYCTYYYVHTTAATIYPHTLSYHTPAPTLYTRKYQKSPSTCTAAHSHVNKRPAILSSACSLPHIRPYMPRSTVKSSDCAFSRPVSN